MIFHRNGSITGNKIITIMYPAAHSFVTTGTWQVTSKSLAEARLSQLGGSLVPLYRYTKCVMCCEFSQKMSLFVYMNEYITNDLT